MTDDNKSNCLSYWFPKIEAAGLPVPRTTIVRTACRLVELSDGEMPEGFGALVESIAAAAEALGWPVFLRTGHTAGKHDWGRTCYLQRSEDIGQHVFNLVEFSEIVDFYGLPCDVWVVREFLDIEHSFHAFRGMPIGREFRAFTSAGETRCVHPYWPPPAIQRPDDRDWASKLAELSRLGEDAKEIVADLASRAAKAVDGGDWSVDCCETTTGEWILTDMAEAGKSFHWPGCCKAR